MQQQSDALRCRACDKPIKEHTLDTELCHICMAVVYDQIKDIDGVVASDYMTTNEAYEFLQQYGSLLEPEITPTGDIDD